eukprot:1157878-Pelagomonas_calceolata.AAC.4
MMPYLGAHAEVVVTRDVWVCSANCRGLGGICLVNPPPFTPSSAPIHKTKEFAPLCNLPQSSGTIFFTERAADSHAHMSCQAPAIGLQVLGLP